MISYQSQATRDANNAAADKHMAGRNTGVDRAAPKPGARTEALATAHADALARRKAG